MKWDGLDDLKDALRRLPTDLRDEARGIVLEAAEAAWTRAYAGYGEHTGNLRRGLYVRPIALTAFGAEAVLVNRAKHAWLWDNGTEARHYTSKKGTRHATGAMWGRRPPPHTFVKAVTAVRPAMWDRLAALLEARGLTVTRHAA